MRNVDPSHVAAPSTIRLKSAGSVGGHTSVARPRRTHVGLRVTAHAVDDERARLESG
ncbi:MAG: hypothetical protein WKF58_07565 [Ilumatobacteraceae bacterium]